LASSDLLQHGKLSRRHYFEFYNNHLATWIDLPRLASAEFAGADGSASKVTWQVFAAKATSTRVLVANFAFVVGWDPSRILKLSLEIFPPSGPSLPFHLRYFPLY
jgi:hypothetical protein